MDIYLIIFISLVLGLKGNIDRNQKKINFKTFLKEFLIIGISLSYMDFISERYNISSSWIFGGLILVVAIDLTITAFIFQLKKK